LDGTSGLDEGRDQYDIRDFSQMVSRGGFRGKVADQEQESLRRMIFGYCLVSRGHMVRFKLSFNCIV